MTDQPRYVDEAIADGAIIVVDAPTYIPTEAEINAYFLKQFRYAQDNCVGGSIELQISARAHNSANTIEIAYSAEVGEWEKAQKFKSNSLVTSIYRVVKRYHEACACEVKAIPVF